MNYWLHNKYNLTFVYPTVKSYRISTVLINMFATMSDGWSVVYGYRTVFNIGSSTMSVSVPCTKTETLFTEKFVTETLLIYVNPPAPQYSSATITSVKFHNEQLFFISFLF